MSGSGLFAGPAPRVLSIPADAPFLLTLAQAMVEALAAPERPFALADALVLAPNRRAARGLMDAFAHCLGGAALTPAIRPLGDLGDDPDVWGPEPIAFDIPAAISPLRRRLELAAVIRARDAAQIGADDPVRALALADQLCALLDSAATADAVDWGRLETLVEDPALAAHWRQSAQFLSIISTFWPARLSELGVCDPGVRRNAVLAALAAQWQAAPPDRPIVIAGSTGSVAATQALMRVVCALPKGVVVLPGLDGALDDAAWGALDPQHPQWALRQTLAALNLQRADVRPLRPAGESAQTAAPARLTLLAEALAPAGATADWLARLQEAGGAQKIRAGASGLALVEAPTIDHEAATIAVLLRAVLETPEETAALVTPSADLARRVSAKLARWGLRPVTSVGAPLASAPVGALLSLLLALWQDDGDPLALAALLAHPQVALAPPEECAAFVRAHLRGPRRHLRLDALAEHPVGAHLLQALAPLRAAEADAPLTLDHLAGVLAQTAEAVCAQWPWAGEDGEAAAALLREAIEHGAALGPAAPDQLARTLARLLAARETGPAPGGDPRIAILGPLEARLQRRDLVILGGLNEGVWPEPAQEDGFLSRSMRAALGLPPPEVRLGLAAHDFAQLAAGPRVVLTRAQRLDGAPAVASRWIWRLKTLLRGAGGEALLAPAPAQDPLRLAALLDAPAEIKTLSPPEPRPPPDKRLRRLSVTDVETLIADPYALYAKRILGLQALRPVGAPVGPAERGAAIHKALERFGLGADPATLLGLLRQELATAGVPPASLEADCAWLAAPAAAFAAWQQRLSVASVHPEVQGHLGLPDGVVLSVRADRIDLLPGGAGATILDFKTGTPPSKTEVQDGRKPQLLLEAAMLARGAFQGVPATPAVALYYWRFSGAENAPRPLPWTHDALAPVVEAALERLVALLARYAQPTQAFLCKPRPKYAPAYEDYDHLARRKAWMHAQDEG